MAEIEIDDKIKLKNDVEIFFEKVVTPFGTSAKLDVPKKYIGRRAYIIILKE